jgi:hypothetical protein
MTQKSAVVAGILILSCACAGSPALARAEEQAKAADPSLPSTAPSPVPAPEAAAASDDVETHPGISLEPMYSEAVINYNAQKPVEALKVLDALLKIKPDYTQALELKALVLKGMGKPAESAKNYEALIAATPDKAKAAPYHFELGVIEFNDKHPDAAAAHFHASVEQKFNTDACHFFLGIIAFTQAEKAGKLIESESEFGLVADGTTAELKPAAHYYLGLISYKKGYGMDGTHELIEARSQARDMPGNEIARDIDKAVGAALAPYGKGQLFGNVSLMGGYNSNVLSQPPGSSSANTDASSGPGTAQLLGVAGIGWMSSPLDKYQFLASYRGSGNLNTNGNTSAYQFLSHTADLYVTKDALARTQYGFKLEGNWIFNDATNADTGDKTFSQFSLGAELGPYVRQELAHGMLLTLEAYFRPQHYYQDANAGLTGNDGVLRATLAVDRSDTWWNPTYTFGVERNPTQDPTFNDWGFDLGLADLIRYNEGNTVTLTAGANFYLYLASDPNRYDELLSVRADWIHQLAPRWTTIVDLGYQNNISSQPTTYHFTQASCSAGVGYSF